MGSVGITEEADHVINSEKHWGLSETARVNRNGTEREDLSGSCILIALRACSRGTRRIALAERCTPLGRCAHEHAQSASTIASTAEGAAQRSIAHAHKAVKKHEAMFD